MSKEERKVIEFKNKLKERGIDESELEEYIKILKESTEERKYGLVWEDNIEEVEEELKNKTPILKEEESLSIYKGEEYTDNLLIEGDNLESLTYLKNKGKKVEVIYIDPPYNSLRADGSFIYKDRRLNKEDSYKHSSWLSFMEKRLKIARDLMTEDGVIYISIDDRELYNLKLLCDEIFGEVNFVNNLIWLFENSGLKNPKKRLAKTHEYVLIYAKDLSSFEMNKIRYGEVSEHVIKRFGKYADKNGDITRKALENEHFYLKRVMTRFRNKYGRDAQLNDVVDKIQPNYLRDVINVPTTRTNELKNSFDVEFNSPKPIILIQTLIKLHPNPNATILDFFSGSGTTGHAVIELNKEDGGERDFILCTNNENNICREVTYSRLNKVINGYKTLKGKVVEGIPSNLKYYRTELVYKEEDKNKEEDER